MSFIEPDKKKGFVVVEVNSEVFPIDLVYNAAYLMLDRAYVILDGSPGETVYALLRPRNFKGELEELGRTFYDELVASAFQAVQFVRNNGMQQALLQSISQGQGDVPSGQSGPAPGGASSGDAEEFDEEDIATLWEDKFGGAGEGDSEKE